jgi:hypothetical protein
MLPAVGQEFIYPVEVEEQDLWLQQGGAATHIAY